MKYLIKAYSTIFIDSYTEGETEFVNEFFSSAELEATEKKEAIEKFIEQHLFTDDLSFTEEEDCIHLSLLINEDSLPADEKEKKEWKLGNLTLYSRLIKLEVYKLELV